MLVGERMKKQVITVTKDIPIQEALAMMKRDKFRRLPVVDDRGKLVGIVTESDLLNASPSDATSLSVWEINYLLSKITVEKVMTTRVITVTEDTPIEEAARIMSDNKIGGLPVCRNGEVIGIITETDLFKIFLELLGARTPGIRLTALVKEAPGKLHDMTKAIDELDGNIIALGTFMGETPGNRTVTIKVAGVAKEALVKALEPIIERVVDMREMN